MNIFGEKVRISDNGFRQVNRLYQGFSPQSEQNICKELAENP